MLIGIACILTGFVVAGLTRAFLASPPRDRTRRVLVSRLHAAFPLVRDGFDRDRSGSVLYPSGKRGFSLPQNTGTLGKTADTSGKTLTSYLSRAPAADYPAPAFHDGHGPGVKKSGMYIRVITCDLSPHEEKSAPTDGREFGVCRLSPDLIRFPGDSGTGQVTGPSIKKVLVKSRFKIISGNTRQLRAIIQGRT